eukprot:2946726-Amphidinium_carterae.1
MGDIDAQGEAIVYRPLHLMHVPLHLMQARFGGRRRWKCISPKPFRTAYNPSGQGNCLFKTFGYLAKAHGLRGVSTPYLRRLVQDELEEIYRTNKQVEGKTLEEWASFLQWDPVELIESTTKGRW